MIEVGGQQVKVLYEESSGQIIGQYPEVDRYGAIVYSDVDSDNKKCILDRRRRAVLKKCPIR